MTDALLAMWDRSADEQLDPTQIAHGIVVCSQVEFAPRVAAALSHKNPKVRAAAAWALVRLDPESETTRAALTAALADQHAVEAARDALKLIDERRSSQE